MKTCQFKAGYLADAVAKVINVFKGGISTGRTEGQNKLCQIDGLLQYASSFDVEFPHECNAEDKKSDPVVATLSNIISRGLPTRAPLLLEELFVNIGLTTKDESEFTLDFTQCIEALDYTTIFELLHIVEPQLDIQRENYAGQLDSDAEWQFLNETFGKSPFCKQILQPKRAFNAINSKTDEAQSATFHFEFPYMYANAKTKKQGIIFNVDGHPSTPATYRVYDKYGDAQSGADFRTLRQEIYEEGRDRSAITAQQAIFDIFSKNYNRDVRKYLKTYTLLFTPLAVARIQKTLLEHFQCNPKLLDNSSLAVCIIERDIPCGAIAVQSLQYLFENLNALLRDAYTTSLPKIHLTIIKNSEWTLDTRLHMGEDIQKIEYLDKAKFDILIDHSILRRSGLYRENDEHRLKDAIKIRSAHYVDYSFLSTRQCLCADLLVYRPFVERNEDGSYTTIEKHKDNITFFLQEIFRKKAFREGQLPIVSRALQQKSVLGLLPTGGGKSISYQIAAFLQPGICLVVEPIKSIMEDQIRVLSENGIDCCGLIHANISDIEENNRLVDFLYGENMFFFISPEKFITESFRNILKKIDASRLEMAFSYCVIDEIHCVSEWGHDFRATYPMLRDNTVQLLKSRSKTGVAPLIGLTATASYDVVSDIERELGIERLDAADAVVAIENTIRPELFFNIVDATDDDRIRVLNNCISTLCPFLQQINTESLLRKSIGDHLKNFDENLKINYKKLLLDKNILENKSHNDLNIIVICPVKGQPDDEKGIHHVFEHLSSHSKGYFYAVGDDDRNGNALDVQLHFQSFFANKTRHIVCTKAFGMGIDKQDIRAVYHYYYPGSIEGLVQESGRAGRDRKIAVENILVSNASHYIIDVQKLFHENIHNPLFQNKDTRFAITQAFSERWNDSSRKYEKRTFSTLKDIIAAIDNSNFSLKNTSGNRYNILSSEDSESIRKIIKAKESPASDRFKYIVKKNLDREIHDLFYDKSFKGIDVERSQFWNLFTTKEFVLVGDQRNDMPNQKILANTVEGAVDGETFTFYIAETKIFDEHATIEKILEILAVDPTTPSQWNNKPILELTKDCFKLSKDFRDFLLRLDRYDIIKYVDLTEEQTARIIKLYYRDRDKADTEKLLFRMRSAGLLIDCLKDQKKGFYTCKFLKHASIDNYVNNIKDYLCRYLSERNAVQEIEKLRLRFRTDSVARNLIESMYFLSEFTYREIAAKRKQAIDEIEEILETSISDPLYQKDWYARNQYIKEEIYYHFNSKYARHGFKINGQPFSLLDDYFDNLLSQEEILSKYMDPFDKDEADQNNFKHLLGACKKVYRSLSQYNQGDEWALHLLMAFAICGINDESYTMAARCIELGLENLYKDVYSGKYDLDRTERIYANYLKKLRELAKIDSILFEHIKVIRAKILLRLQSEGVDRLWETADKFLHAELPAM
jgi:ATP-dependent DNA helicase RecQ